MANYLCDLLGCF